MGRLGLLATLLALAEHVLTASTTSGHAVRDASGSIVGPGFVHAPVVRTDGGASLSKRRSLSGLGSSNLTNWQREYVINLTIGGQNVTLAVDTGSSEMWVNPNCSSLNESPSFGSDFVTAAICESLGRYDPDSSKTSQRENFTAVIKYASTAHTNIDYYNDTIEIAGLAIQNQTFGVSTSSSGCATGIIGLAPDYLYGYNRTMDKSLVNMTQSFLDEQFSDANASYEMLLSSMASQGLINRPAFSLDLRNDNETTGSLIFGGVDRSKFSGNLYPLHIFTHETPVEFEPGKLSKFMSYAYNLEVSSVGYSTKDSPSDKTRMNTTAFVAALDSGTANNIIPPGLLAPICSAFGGKNVDALGAFCNVRCDTKDLDLGAMTLGFAGAPDLLLSTSWRNLVYETNILDMAAMLGRTASETADILVDGGVLPPSYRDGVDWDALDADGTTVLSDTAFSADQADGSIPTVCYLNVFEGEANSFILGAPMLRDAYAVFDWESRHVYLGQSADCGTDVVAFQAGTGADAIPTKGNCAGAGAGAGIADPAVNGFDAAVSGLDDLVEGYDISPTHDKAVNEKWKIWLGAVVGGTALVIIAAAVAACLCCRRSRRRVARGMAYGSVARGDLGPDGAAPRAMLDETKIPLVPEVQEYGRLSQVEPQHGHQLYGS